MVNIYRLTMFWATKKKKKVNKFHIINTIETNSKKKIEINTKYTKFHITPITTASTAFRIHRLKEKRIFENWEKRKKQCIPPREQLGNFPLLNWHCSLSHGDLYTFTCFLPAHSVFCPKNFSVSWFNTFLLESYALPSCDLTCYMADFVPLTLPIFAEACI